MSENGIVYNTDAFSGLCDLLSNTVDLIITSPPYDTIYDYDNLSFDEFEDISFEMYRVLVEGGVLVWVVNDQVKNKSKTLTSFKQAIYFKDEVGFNVHDVMIYQKHNFSNPSSNRYHQIFEYMFIFSKGTPRVFNGIRDRKNVYGGKKGCWGKNTFRGKNCEMESREKKINAEFGLRYNIWKYKTGYLLSTKDKVAYKHPAIFPEQLAEDHIKTWTNEGDLVLDPFAGSGTVGKMAGLNNRKFILFEKNDSFVTEIIIPRLSNFKLI